MIRSFLLLALLAAAPAFAAATPPATPTAPVTRSVDDVKGNIKRLSDHVYEEVTAANLSVEKLLQAEALIQQSLDVLRGVPPAQSQPSNKLDRDACMKFALDQGLAPESAAKVCDCISTAVEFNCVKSTITAGYDYTRSATTCTGIKDTQLACFLDILSRGFGPERAHDACVR